MVSIRRAVAADVPALAAVAAAAYRHYVPRIGRPPAPMTADYAHAVRECEVWAAEDDGEIAGFVILIAQPGHLLMENIAVVPAAQRRGTGAKLMALAEDRAAALGLPEIRLYTNQAMTENLAFYPRRGYTETHRAEQDGFQRVFFAKRLAGRARPGG